MAISLESAANLLEKWVFPIFTTRFITHTPIVKNGEVRHKHIGVDDNGNIVFMVTTMRYNETVRVISFRKAHASGIATFKALTKL
jgi:uncharacterized DUF497 family protein